MLEVPLDMIVTDKGVAKKKPASSAVVKGARASKKLAAQRGRASPKKARGSASASASALSTSFAASSASVIPNSASATALAAVSCPVMRFIINNSPSDLDLS
ncbi:hypothetical protein Bca52824_086540 [Brassica carinata]|uniref:Uncharacterized protein n=1 Tax=Brassica carinata TaxID=52824 RepID=A0A8X7PAA5_BRACI|nr:hypothetical protein Bca52824_086540 [Brassica carinata]